MVGNRSVSRTGLEVSGLVDLGILLLGELVVVSLRGRGRVLRGWHIDVRIVRGHRCLVMWMHRRTCVDGPMQQHVVAWHQGGHRIPIGVLHGSAIVVVAGSWRSRPDRRLAAEKLLIRRPGLSGLVVGIKHDLGGLVSHCHALLVSVHRRRCRRAHHRKHLVRVVRRYRHGLVVRAHHVPEHIFELERHRFDRLLNGGYRGVEGVDVDQEAIFCVAKLKYNLSPAHPHLKSI